MNSNEENSNQKLNEPNQGWGRGRGFGRHGHDHGGRCGKRRFIKIPFIILAIVLIKSAVVMLLWNELMPDLFHVSTLSYLQSIELTVLMKLLVSGGMRPFGGHHGGPFRGRFGRKFGGEEESCQK